MAGAVAQGPFRMVHCASAQPFAISFGLRVHVPKESAPSASTPTTKPEAARRMLSLKMITSFGFNKIFGPASPAAPRKPPSPPHAMSDLTDTHGTARMERNTSADQVTASDARPSSGARASLQDTSGSEEAVEAAEVLTAAQTEAHKTRPSSWHAG